MTQTYEQPKAFCLRYIPELKCVKLGNKRFQIMRGDEKFIDEYSGTRLSWCMARNKIIKELLK